MTRQTALLRTVLVAVLIGMLVGAGLLYLASMESATNWPTLAHLRIPVFVLVVLAFIPLVGVDILGFRFLRLVDHGDVFSEATVTTLRRMRLLFAVFTAYVALGLVAFWAVTGLMQLVLLLAWVGVALVGLAGYTTMALFEHVFTEATTLRQDNELTV